MCWNEEVSLNTFLFSSFILLFIIYNNIFTQYKIEILNNIWEYAFFASFISIQLVEFFIWRNLNNKYYNYIFSFIACILLMLQPFFSIMIISEKHIRNIILSLFFLWAIPFVIYKLYTSHFYSEKSKNGHLKWLFLQGGGPLTFIIWMFFFSFSFIFEKKWITILFGISLLFISIYNYWLEKAWGSMWCWLANAIMIFYAIYLLYFSVILPYYILHNSIC